MTAPVRVLVDERFLTDELLEHPNLEILSRTSEELSELSPEDLEGVDALFAYRPALPAEAFEAVGDDLRYVMRPGAGYDNLDLGAATEHDVVVMHAPQGPRNAVVEGTIGLMISCARSLHVHNARIREHGFSGRADYPAFELGSSTVGIIGLGLIGKGIAASLVDFGASVQAHDPYVDEEAAAELGVDLVGLDELLETSDFVSIHVPMTDETHHMLGEDDFRKMQESAFLVNAARGGIYPDEALAKAVRNDWIAGAAVDVFEHRSDFEENPLLQLDQTEALLTPHILGNRSEDARDRVLEIVVDAIVSIGDGEFPPNVLNPDAYDEPVPDDRTSPAY